MSSASLSDAIASPNPTLSIAIQIRIRDSLGKTHDFSPVFSDTIQSLITVIQNCPFVRLPMKIQYDGRDLSPSVYVWNLLQNDIEMTKLRASEVLARDAIHL